MVIEFYASTLSPIFHIPILILGLAIVHMYRQLRRTDGICLKSFFLFPGAKECENLSKIEVKIFDDYISKVTLYFVY